MSNFLIGFIILYIAINHNPKHNSHRTMKGAQELQDVISVMIFLCSFTFKFFSISLLKMLVLLNVNLFGISV